MKLKKLIMWRSFSSHKESYCQEIWEELEGETFLSLKVELRICEKSNSNRGGEVRVYTHSSVFNKLKREEILTARYLLRLWKSKIFNSSVHTQVREVKFFNSSVHTQVKEVKNF